MSYGFESKKESVESYGLTVNDILKEKYTHDYNLYEDDCRYVFRVVYTDVGNLRDSVPILVCVSDKHFTCTIKYNTHENRRFRKFSGVLTLTQR